ncbi:HD domain-containing protein [Rubrivirga marina]|uniref:HD/PDEase domain-containing protein n=1 Tax=Rubrivirga marina TaxID=1196024 RepID=A0A271J2D7_9BACT|nr:HD domain-containing protein [Rubrivirga marina]PAP77520.1 hypothetical protein BSZ37_14265 [Rubrivirga marina]
MTTDALFSPLVERAIEIAAEWHDGTYRKGRWTDPCVGDPGGTPSRVPAMAHVTAVALTVQRAGWGDEAVAAAFLHDALEDANRHGDALGRATLVALVGEEVVRIVEAVSEPKRDDVGDWLPWRTRKEAYLRSLSAGPVEAVAVSLADKLHNAYSMASSLEAGIDIFSSAPGRKALSAGAADQRWFFEAVLGESESVEDPRLTPMRDRLRQEVARFATLTETRGHPE